MMLLSDGSEVFKLKSQQVPGGGRFTDWICDSPSGPCDALSVCVVPYTQTCTDTSVITNQTNILTDWHCCIAFSLSSSLCIYWWELHQERGKTTVIRLRVFSTTQSLIGFICWSVYLRLSLLPVSVSIQMSCSLTNCNSMYNQSSKKNDIFHKNLASASFISVMCSVRMQLRLCGSRVVSTDKLCSLSLCLLRCFSC